MSKARGVVLLSAFMILLIGAALVGTSIWLFVQDFEFKHLTGNKLIDYGVMFIGVFVFLLGFLGFCGATFQKRFVLYIYLFFMILIILAELALTAYVLFQIRAVKSFIEKNWVKLNDDARIAVQSKLDCCGIGNTQVTPVSSQHKSCFENDGSQKSDCLSKVASIIKENDVMVGSTIAGVILIQIIVVVISVKYAKQLALLHDMRRVRPAKNVRSPIENHRDRPLAGGVRSPHSMDGHQMNRIMVEEVDDYPEEDQFERRTGIERDHWARHSSRRAPKRP